MPTPTPQQLRTNAVQAQLSTTAATLASDAARPSVAHVDRVWQVEIRLPRLGRDGCAGVCGCEGACGCVARSAARRRAGASCSSEFRAMSSKACSMLMAVFAEVSNSGTLPFPSHLRAAGGSGLASRRGRLLRGCEPRRSRSPGESPLLRRGARALHVHLVAQHDEGERLRIARPSLAEELVPPGVEALQGPLVVAVID